MPIPKLAVLFVLTKKEADFLEDLLDDASARFQEKRRSGAGPGPKERLLNSLTEEVLYGLAHAQALRKPRTTKKPSHG